MCIFGHIICIFNVCSCISGLARQITILSGYKRALLKTVFLFMRIIWVLENSRGLSSDTDTSLPVISRVLDTMSKVDQLPIHRRDKNLGQKSLPGNWWHLSITMWIHKIRVTFPLFPFYSCLVLVPNFPHIGEFRGITIFSVPHSSRKS